MRILDNHKDYYDYFQSYNDDLVYDRRGSVILTDKDLCNIWGFDKKPTDKYLLLNVGYSYWLMFIKPLNIETTNGFTNVTDYSLELVEYWKDYNHFNKLSFGTIDKWYSTEFLFSKKWDWKSKTIDEIKLGNYEYKYDFIERLGNNLIFTNTKIPSAVNAYDLFNAFEEYFSHLRDDVDCDKMTNDEKIISHGFDMKESFRGKK